MSPATDETLQELKRFLLQEDLTAEEVTEAAALTSHLEFHKGDLILKEGDINEHLYFLLEGSVSILKAGEKIASLFSPGDLLGEMSLITGKACSASILADSAVLVMRFEVKQIGRLSSKLQARFTSALYHLFSKILAQKLALTNEKARLFEITNRELEKAKKALETASQDKIQELASNGLSFFQKIHGLYTGELQTLKEQLSNLGPAGEPLNLNLKKISTSLETYSHIYEQQQILHSKKVLVVEDNIPEQIRAKMALGGTGIGLSIATNMEEAKTALQTDKFHILCMSSTMTELIPIARSLQPELKLVFMTSEPISGHFQTLQKFPELSTIIVRHAEDRAFTLKNMATTIQKLGSQDIFGMEKYLAWGTLAREHRVFRSDQRSALIDEMTRYFKSLGIREKLNRRSSLVAEELLMNAIYDAPVDPSGKPLYNHLERTIPVSLTPDQEAVFRYACDGSLLAVSVEDPFGRITRSMILHYLEKCLGGIGSKDEEGKGGGGNGLFQSISASSLVVFNVKQNVKTEVIALFNINIQVNRIETDPSFHFFET